MVPFQNTTELETMIHDLTDIVGENFVISKPEDLIAFEYDGSVDRAIPTLVALPSSTEEVSRIVKVAARYQLPVIARGAGTGLSGGAVAQNGGLVLPLTRMTQILDIDPENRIAILEPGVVNENISSAANKYGMYFAPDPSSQKACTIGGNVAENSGGPHCLAYGVTTNHVMGMEVVFADGSIHWLGGKTRENGGYDLRGIIVGSEGTLGVVTKIAVRLLKKPESIETMVAIFEKLDHASATVSGIIAAGIIPTALELMDDLCVGAMEATEPIGYPTGTGAVLLVEVDGLAEAVEEEIVEIKNICQSFRAIDIRVANNAEERETLWSGRKNILGALGRIAPNYYLVDGTVPRTRILEVLAGVNKISQYVSLPIANLMHAGDGNLHPLILFDERASGELDRALVAGEEILKLCVAAGGVLSGEHGIGIEKQEYMPMLFSKDDMESMARLAPAFGSAGIFNPGKIFPTGKTRTVTHHARAVSRTGTGEIV